jgi:hypothetical protein
VAPVWAQAKECRNLAVDVGWIGLDWIGLDWTGWLLIRDSVASNGTSLSEIFYCRLGRWDDRAAAFVIDPGVYGVYASDCNVNGVLDDVRGCVQASAQVHVVAGE